jgi:hypothetical protein
VSPTLAESFTLNVEPDTEHPVPDAENVTAPSPEPPEVVSDSEPKYPIVLALDIDNGAWADFACPVTVAVASEKPDADAVTVTVDEAPALSPVTVTVEPEKFFVPDDTVTTTDSDTAKTAA